MLILSSMVFLELLLTGTWELNKMRRNAKNPTRCD